MGEQADYNAPVNESGLWKITPKDSSKPTLYYSTKKQRIVKIKSIVNGVNTETQLEYCDNTCKLPGTLKKATITTALSGGNSSKVIVEILQAKQHHSLPSKMFDVE